ADGLKRLFDDESSEVRQAAAQSISHMRGQQLGEHEELARALLRSRALAEGRSQLMHALKSSTAEVATPLVTLAEQMLEDGDGLGDIRTSAAGDAKELSELLIRVLGDTRDHPTLRMEALDVLDRLVAAGAWGVVDAMASVER
ncbi:MAG: hypothetical protein M3R46_03105, partial [Actinomycetota bacterium]|nr:hypothetical protein [Actinomycetota bacterium]